MWKTAIAGLALVSQFAFAGPKIEFETTLGSFVIEVNEDKAPITAANFLRYVKDGSYVGTIFHRVIPGFMAQGGGFTPEMEKAPTYEPIKLESNNGLKNRVASVAMARTKFQDSATRQFFINYKDNSFLDYDQRPPGYAVFGQVIQGYDVIQKMATQKTRTIDHYQNVPATPIVITKVTRLP